MNAKVFFTEPEADTALCILHALIDMGYEDPEGSGGLRSTALDLAPAFEFVYEAELKSSDAPWDLELVPELVDLCQRNGWLNTQPDNFADTLLDAVRKI